MTLTPSLIYALRAAGYHGPIRDWRSPSYTLGEIPGVAGNLHLIATNGSLAVFQPSTSSSVYWLGHLEHFTGRPLTTAGRARLSPEEKIARAEQRLIKKMLKRSPSLARNLVVADQRRQAILDTL